jgi:hypothetical protein
MLDLTVLRQEDGSMEFDVYRKPTHTDQCIPWDSAQPLHHKGSTIHALTRRAHLLPTGPVRQAAKLRRIEQVLAINGYPLLGNMSLPIPPPSSVFRREEAPL